MFLGFIIFQIMEAFKNCIFNMLLYIQFIKTLYLHQKKCERLTCQVYPELR